MRYRYNPYCSCARCRAHGYMGPAVLITIGVLFLLAQVASSYWLDFDRTWPALLIVIGWSCSCGTARRSTGTFRASTRVPPAHAGYAGECAYGQPRTDSPTGKRRSRA